MNFSRRDRRTVRTLMCAFLAVASFDATAAITGIVFRDYNSNGLRDPGATAAAADVGLGNVGVRAYDAAGACGTPTTTSAVPASLGTYSLDTSGCAAGILRIEFSGFPAGLQASFHGRPSSGPTTASQAGSSVQFAADGTADLELALNEPLQYCQNDPQVLVAQQVFGDAQAAANAALDSVVRFPYSAAGSTGTPQPVGPVGVADVPLVGTIYGLAFDRRTDQLYMGAYHKRHTGFGPSGTGAVYRVNAVSSGAPGAATLFADLNALFGAGTAGTDSVRGNYEGGGAGDQTWDQVGKSSLGDLELSPDGSRLYLVNLTDRLLYSIPTTGAITSGTVTRVPIPAPCANNAADARPFGLKFNDAGVLYVSGVCSAQSNQVLADLSAYLYTFDTTTSTFSAAPVFQFALNYPRAAGNQDTIADPTGDIIWRAWSTAPGIPAGSDGGVWAQPMFADIAFDGPDLVIGLRDRHGDQTGSGAGGTIRGYSGGDLLRACSNGAGGWNLEQNGSCGGITGAVGTATNQARGPASVGNARGGEYYGLEHYSNTTPPFFITDTPPDYNGRHDETAQGSIAQTPGFPNVMSTVMDPFSFDSGGVRWFWNTEPNNVALTRGYRIFLTSGNGFAKANGMGDLDPLCRAAPVEVGNYIWNDFDHDGVMDPGEPPIAGVVVNLYTPAGVLLGTATTGANGEFYFIFTQGATDPSTADNSIILPDPYFGTYVVAVAPSNFIAGGALANLTPTTPNNAGPGDGQLRDSNGVPLNVPGVGNVTGVSVTLTGPGSNNHTIDFGFGALDFGDLPDSAAGTGTGNYNTLASDNGAAHGIVPGLFLGASVDAEGDGQPDGAASGDDLAGTPDDEDGIITADLTLRRLANATIRANATNTGATAAQLCGFVDFNGDGDFLDAGETAAAVPVPAGSNNVQFTLNFGTVPLTAVDLTYARFRLGTTGGACVATGTEADGEVEDYLIVIFSVDYGDLPDTGAGTGAANYNTLAADNGPSHVIVPGLFLGATVDAEGDGQPNAPASGDDIAGTPDDEDGVTIADLNLIGGSAATIRVTVTNTTASPARLCGFLDYDADGTLETSATLTVPAGTVGAVQTLNFGTVPLAAAPATFARFRLDNGTGACSPTGAALSGEVEDYPVGIAQLDYGDLPNSYATLLAQNGARHPIVNGLRLGANEDAEGDGQPTPTANGDDSNGTPDDEDGITIADLNLIAGSTASVRANATNLLASPAQLCGFIDFNNDGDFADAGEIAPAIAVPSGSSNVQFTLNFGTVPLNAAAASYARFRLSSDIGACAADGLATNGEVEDYVVGVTALDLGDLPDTGAGSGPGNYATLIADNGPRHPIVAGLFLGASEDAEGDGQPNTAANGDDSNGTPDDEDGITVADLNLVGGNLANVRANATNTLAAAAQLCGFIDFNGDGDFADAGETAPAISVPPGSNNAPFTLNFGSVPLTAVASTYARFRLNTGTAPCSATGLAPDGEVEDYAVSIGQLDFGDLPDTGVGTGAGNYATTLADDGARHVIDAELFLGGGVDAEADGQPNTSADGDDSNGTPDDEDGVVIADLTLTAGAPASVRVNTTNTLGSAAQLCGFIDFNGDGDFADAGETAPAVAVPPGSNVQHSLNFGSVPASAVASTYARFRLSTDAGACSAVGQASNGEVEDYRVSIALVDLGDLPDTGAGSGPGNYATLLADGGASHAIVPNLFLGAGVDAEADGQPGASANGDDANGTPDDEDGVNTADLALQRGVAPAVRVSVTNGSGSAALLCGFIDYNGDGDFADAGETAQSAVPDGTTAAQQTLTFGAVPNSAVATSYARFRLSNDAACAPAGASASGEVEDYPVNVGSGPLSLGNLVWNDRNNNGTVDPGEPGLGGVAVNLYEDADNNGTADGPAIATTATDAAGAYLFQNLSPSTYIVEITPPAGYVSSSGSNLPYTPTGPYEPAPDPDNDVNDDDNGSTQLGVIRAAPVTLTVGGEPVNDGDADADSNLSVDFGLLGNFDLALTKRVTAGQPGPFVAGSDVSFDITVYNQGGMAAYNVLVNDYIPAGFALSPAETNWTPLSATLATRTLAGPLAPGASQTVTILLRVQPGASSPLVNRAEIGSADDDTDPNNTPPTDVDSTPDSIPGNDGGGEPDTPSDDAIGGNGSGAPGSTDPNGDEDDADPATVSLGGTGGPSLGLAKSAQVLSISGGSGGYGTGGTPPSADLAYVIVVRNYSTQPVTSLQVVENLVTTFGAGNNWNVSGVTSPGLTLNGAYDGRAVTNLLAGSDTLAAGATQTIRLVVSVRFTPGQVYTNQVSGTGVVGGTPVSDLSTDGSDPAAGGTDPGSVDVPTPIRLGTQAVPALGTFGLLMLLAGLILTAQLRLRRGAAGSMRR